MEKQKMYWFLTAERKSVQNLNEHACMQMYQFKIKLAYTVNLIPMHAPNSLNDNISSSPLSFFVL